VARGAGAAAAPAQGQHGAAAGLARRDLPALYTAGMPALPRAAERMYAALVLAESPAAGAAAAAAAAAAPGSARGRGAAAPHSPALPGTASGAGWRAEDHDDAPAVDFDPSPYDDAPAGFDDGAFGGDDTPATPGSGRHGRGAEATAATPNAAAAAVGGGAAGTPAATPGKRRAVEWPADAEQLLEAAGDDEGGEGGSGGASDDGLSERTRLVVAALRAALAPTPGKKQAKRARGAGGADGEARRSVPLSTLTGGRSRRGAAVAFYECLVLQNRAMVVLEQRAPYGEIDVVPTAAMLAAF